MRNISIVWLLLTVLIACSTAEQSSQENPLTLHFDLNIDTLSNEHVKILDAVGKLIQDNPTQKLITGYYSDVNEKDNFVNGIEISQRRVNLALDYLKSKWNYNPLSIIVEESVSGETLGYNSKETNNSEKKIERECRCVYFKFEN